MLWDTRCMEYRNKEAKVAEFAAELNRTGMYFESNMNCERKVMSSVKSHAH